MDLGLRLGLLGSREQLGVRAREEDALVAVGPPDNKRWLAAGAACLEHDGVTIGLPDSVAFDDDLVACLCLH